MNYTLTINEKQARAINAALEDYFCLRMGQCWELTDDLAFQGFDYTNHTDEDFNRRIERRNIARELIETVFRVVFPDPLHHDIGEQARICQDVWQVIRHQLWLDNPDRSEWTVDSFEPLCVSQEPLVKIERLP